MGLEGQGLGLGKTEDGKGVAILLDGDSYQGHVGYLIATWIATWIATGIVDSYLDSYLDSYVDCG